MMIHMATSFTVSLLLFQYLLIKLKKNTYVICILPDKVADIMLWTSLNFLVLQSFDPSR